MILRIYNSVFYLKWSSRRSAQLHFSEKTTVTTASMFKAPADWNRVPVDTRSMSSLGVFKQTLSFYFELDDSCYQWRCHRLYLRFMLFIPDFVLYLVIHSHFTVFIIGSFGGCDVFDVFWSKLVMNYQV